MTAVRKRRTGRHRGTRKEDFVCGLIACAGSQKESGNADLEEKVPDGMEDSSSDVGQEEAEVQSDSEMDIAEFHLEVPTPGVEQVIYLWEEGKMPTPRTYSESSNYFDPPDFRPNMEYYPANPEVPVKGAVMLCAGGAFAFRGNQGDTYPTAKKLTDIYEDN